MITEHIDFFMSKFPQMTKEESDFVEEVLKWDDEKRSAFIMAKRLFEDKE